MVPIWMLLQLLDCCAPEVVNDSALVAGWHALLQRTWWPLEIWEKRSLTFLALVLLCILVSQSFSYVSCRLLSMPVVVVSVSACLLCGRWSVFYSMWSSDTSHIFGWSVIGDPVSKSFESANHLKAKEAKDQTGLVNRCPQVIHVQVLSFLLHSPRVSCVLLSNCMLCHVLACFGTNFRGAFV